MGRAAPLILALGGLAALSAMSLFIGAIPLSPAAVLHDPQAQALLTGSRIPRTLAAILAGGALAASGQIMQILARNRFVEPMSAGAGQSAALGVLGAAMLFPGAPIWVKMAMACGAALVGAAGLVALLRPLPQTDPLLAPLVALVYGGLIGGVASWIAYEADLLQFLGVWLNGELSGAVEGRYELLWLAAAACAGSWLIADRLTALALGEETARSLGLPVRSLRAAGLAAVAATTAVAVVTVGAVPFVGLVAPNLVARFKGDDLRGALPWAAWGGAMLVLGADILGRVIRMPFEIPVSAMVGLIGAAIFLALIGRAPRHGF